MKQANINLKLIHAISDYVWSLVQFWGPFSQTIIGGRFVQCLDEITVLIAQMSILKINNLADYVKKVNLLKEECLVWLDKSRRRRLLSNEDYQKLYKQIKLIKVK